MKQIELTQGLFATVDDEDYERVAKFKWSAFRITDNLVYAARSVRMPDGTHTMELMHRFILGSAKGERTDHRDGNGLINTRENLRRCTHAENMRNRKMQRNNTSGYRGVYFNICSGRWMSQIRVNRKKMFLGQYSDRIAAARAYDASAREHFGEFARLNFPS